MKQLLVSLLLVSSMPAIGQIDLPKKAFGVTISFPWVNNMVHYNYHLNTIDGKTGFGGFSGSLFYKTQKEKISLSIGLMGTVPVPMGPYDHDNINYTEVFVNFIEGTFHKRVWPRINLIGGFNYMEWDYSYFKDDTESYFYSDFTGGLTTGAEYLFGRNNFSLALFYRPALVNFDGLGSKYRHVISLDARIDINIFRRY